MSELNDPSVDVVVATYGSPNLLEACLRSLRTMPFRSYRLIVVDDGSPEPALAAVKRTHPGATVLRSRTNGGLVRALNKGIRHGRAPLVALLNDDTEVSPEWLGALVDAAQRHPEAGSFASKMLMFDDPPRLHSAGDGFGAWGMPYNRGVWLEDVGQYDEEEPVFGACAGAALYRRSALNDVGLPSGAPLNPSLFMYLEDVELAWRLQLKNYKCIYVPSASVRHHLSATGGGSLASYYVSRNILRILCDAVPADFLRANALRVTSHHLGRTMRHIRHAREPVARAALRGTCDGLLYVARHLVSMKTSAPARHPLPVST